MAKQPLTPKQSVFASLIARGQNLTDAYRHAYDAERMKESTVRTESSREASKPHVAEAIANLKRNHRPTERHVEELRADWVLTRLQEEAISEANPASSRVRALEVLGRSLSLFDGSQPEKVEHRSPEEITEELVAKMREFGMIVEE